MSNKLNRAHRRALESSRDMKVQVFNQEKDSLRRHLEKAENEMRESFEHLYQGMYFASMAIAMHRIGLSQRTIYRAMEKADEIYGQLYDGTIKAEDLPKMCEDESGVRILYSASNEFMLLLPFEEKKNKPNAYYNLTGMQAVKKIKEG